MPADDYSPELLGLYDPRHLDHHRREVDRFRSVAAEWSDDLPAAVEIGSHRGAFLRGVAAAHAPEPVLGIEWRNKYHRMAIDRLQKRAVTNARSLQGDARLAIPIIFPPESVEAFYVTFPDPWWKTRHAHRRVLDPLFLRVLARRLKPGGRLYLKSDVFEYLYRVRSMAEASGAFRPLPWQKWPDERDWTLTTREKKCMDAAIPFGRGYYERRDDFDAKPPSEPERAEDFPFDEAVDPVSVIKGPPPKDREQRKKAGRRRS